MNNNLQKLEEYSEIRNKHQSNDFDQTISNQISIAKHNIDQYNAELNAYVRIYEPNDYHIHKNGNIYGMLISIKDVICYKDHVCQASSKILEGFTSCINATVVDRIIESGGIIMGHTNCDEFAMGSTNENSVYGICRNGLNINKVPGGSSGGAAVSVQMNMCNVAIGTDTGGSVRQSAAFCGIIGFKPTYGRISRYGIIPYASSFDTVGLLSKSIKDIALVFDQVCGYDDKDYTSSIQPKTCCFDKLKTDISKKYKIICINNTLHNLQKEIEYEIKNSINKLKQENHNIEYIDFKYIDYLLPIYYVITAVEASSNLAKYDGIRYGYQSKNIKTFDDIYIKTRSEGFGYEVKKRLILGNYILSSKENNEMFIKAKKIRRLIVDELISILDNNDFIILPTTATTAFDINSDMSGMDKCLSDIFTVLASIVGLPAISIPIGNDKDGMPIGLQIISKYYNEEELLHFASYLQNLIDNR